VADALTIARRSLKAMSRTPKVVVITAIQPVILMLTFRYVFGGSIQIPGSHTYVDFPCPACSSKPWRSAR
jgi:ABC-2 type transport system permease protein